MPLTDKYINPLTDFGFKKIFGTETNKDLLIDFLNQLLPERHQIEDLVFDKNEHLANSEFDRIAIFDIFCQSKKGEQFIVEIQRKRQKNFKERSILYSTYPIHEYADKGKDYDFELPVIYTIALLDFTFEDYENTPHLIHKVKLKDEQGKVFYDKLSYIYIELPKFNKTIDQLETHFDKWLFILKWLSKLQKRPKALQERVFQKIFKLAEIAKYSKMERGQYEQSLKHYRDLQNSLSFAKEEGKEEVLLKIIKNLIDNDFSLEQISKFTEVSVIELKKYVSEQGWNSK